MEKKKTAAYCRVSTLNDSQDGSFEVQCAYFEKRIKEDPAMEFVGVYGDRGLSGRSMKGRTELNRLIKDCEEGKVERILCKSISRFVRCMLECVQVIRYLSELGVGLYFEREKLDTQSMNGELILGILASIAEEESNSISENAKWAHKQYVERGEPFYTARYGYVSVGKNHRWEIVPREAEIVRKAFYMAGMCHNYKEIVTELNRMEKDSGGKRNWKTNTLVAALSSEAYIGDFLSNKTCHIVGKDGHRKTIQNKGQADQILIQEHHPALVSHELYEIVQMLLRARVLFSFRSNYYPEELLLMEKAKRIAAKEAETWAEEGHTVVVGEGK
ncbi:MAG: recombinase family protein [Parasporobacterium sp.]|nr:recombinase family protein [Parasporobacterium sp.]